jgi:4-hydroxybenzoate polyprenyltransferase
VTPRALLRLFRIPNVFTAFSNVVAGVGLARRGAFEPRDLALVGASGALYLAGMVWNDYYDRAIDAEERPDRPIPAGEVTPTAAAAIGGSLLGLGLALAAWHGIWPMVVTVALTGSILLYDAQLKDTRWGPLAMGVCRTLNVGLGLSAAFRPELWLWALPIILGVFTLLITQLSRFEVGGTAPERLRRTVWGFAALFVLLMAALVWVHWASGAGVVSLLVAALAAAFIEVRGKNRFAPLLHDVTPPSLGRAIGGGILLMPALDAAFLAAAGALWLAPLAFALVGPALLLKRWYYMT